MLSNLIESMMFNLQSGTLSDARSKASVEDITRVADGKCYRYGSIANSVCWMVYLVRTKQKKFLLTYHLPHS